ncbi:hypothetical protein ACFYPN_15770 [Streptomyces sp. NPDC005576]|uniref:hypothetical protein n=1 Tax=Streptomyces sp. NPDC005576 TaxID=3364726 RepID=UPI0036CC3E7A
MNRETFDYLLDLTANPFIPELHHDDCDDESCVRCITPADADVNANVDQGAAARIAAGIAAEQRHLLYDADPDSTVPALVNLHHTPRRRTG